MFGGIITAFAFNGYEAGKTFFVVPVLAALTVSGIPVVRRLAWIAIAAAIAWLVFDQRPMNTEGALQSIPRDARAFARGVLAFAKSYVVDWDSVYVDRDRFLELKNPFHNYRKEAANFAKKL